MIFFFILNITLEHPKYSLKSFLYVRSLWKPQLCDLCLFLHKICCKTVWKFCEIWIFMGIAFQVGKILWDFISQCEIRHVWNKACYDTGNVEPYFLLKNSIKKQTVICNSWPASVAQLDAPSDWRPGGHGFNPHPGRQPSFLEIDHEIFSMVILSLPLIQEGQLSVSCERMCTILLN